MNHRRLQRANRRAWFAWAPEWGCTCKAAVEQPQARSMQGSRRRRHIAAADNSAGRDKPSAYVGQDRALRVENRTRDDVLRGDQLDLFLLALSSRPRGSQLGSLPEIPSEKADSVAYVFRKRASCLPRTQNFWDLCLTFTNLSTSTINRVCATKSFLARVAFGHESRSVPETPPQCQSCRFRKNGGAAKGCRRQLECWSISI